MTYAVLKLTGSCYQYSYEEVPQRLSEEKVRNYCQLIRSHFAPIAKNFSDIENSRWVLRHYLAIKYAVSASLLSGSAHCARDRNLLIGVPYFNYYALLNCCRAFLLTCPDVLWEGENTLQMTHQKIINVTENKICRLDAGLAQRIKQQLELARDHRELYSYRFPGTGLGLINGYIQPEEIASLARLILELAMLNSECFDASLQRHAPQEVKIPALQDHDWAVAYEIAGASVKDPYDRERFGKLVNKWGRVSTLEVMTSDGMIEDFYGAWTTGDEPAQGDFNPDDWMNHLLSL